MVNSQHTTHFLFLIFGFISLLTTRVSTVEVCDATIASFIFVSPVQKESSETFPLPTFRIDKCYLKK